MLCRYFSTCLLGGKWTPACRDHDVHDETIADRQLQASISPPSVHVTIATTLTAQQHSAFEPPTGGLRHLATGFVLVRLYVIYRRRSCDSRTRLSSACSACCKFSSSLTLRHLHRFGRESEATTGCYSVDTVLSMSAQGCRGWQSRQRRMPPAARRGLHLLDRSAGHRGKLPGTGELFTLFNMLRWAIINMQRKQ